MGKLRRIADDGEEALRVLPVVRNLIIGITIGGLILWLV